MRNLLFLFLILIPFLGYGYDKNRMDRRFMVGPGITATFSEAGFKAGGNLKVDFLIKKNLNAGFKYIYAPTPVKRKIVDGLNTKSIGHDFFVNGNGSYYLTGDNQKSQFGLYSTLGAGYWNHTATTFTIYTNNKSRENTYIQKGLMTSVSLGFDGYMMAGRLFFDATAFMNIKGKEFDRVYDTATPSMNSETITPMSFKFIPTFFLNVGYSFTF